MWELLIALSVGGIIGVSLIKSYLGSKRKRLAAQVKILNRKGAANKDRFSVTKLPEKIDTIIIGSGIGGLSLGAYLSKCDETVVVLEQHDIAGGCTHAFESHGYEFDSGIHYIGNLMKRKDVLDVISSPPIEWIKMGVEDDYTYNEIILEGKSYKLRAGKDSYIRDLSLYFPDETQAIKKYVELVQKVSQLDTFFLLKILKPRWLAKLLAKIFCREYHKYVTISTYDILRTLTKNESMIAVMCAQFGEIGIPPKDSPFFMYAGIVNHYLEGGWYPRGGTSALAKSIIPTIERSGGRVLVGKAVERILLDDISKVAVGVEMSDGTIIHASKIVSACGIYNTYRKLLPFEVVIHDPKYVLTNTIPRSSTAMYLFVGLDEALELPSYNLWYMPDKDYTKLLGDFYESPFEAQVPAFIAFPSSKDPTYGDRWRGKKCGLVLCPAKYSWVSDWENIPHNKRAKLPEYQKFKAKFEAILLDILYKVVPATQGKVKYTELGTPLTFRDYIGSERGECYGLESTPLRFTTHELTPYTSIPNLFITGQDICTLGFAGALLGGVLTAHAMKGYNTIGSLIAAFLGKTLISDLTD